MEVAPSPWRLDWDDLSPRNETEGGGLPWEVEEIVGSLVGPTRVECERPLHCSPCIVPAMLYNTGGTCETSNNAAVTQSDDNPVDSFQRK